MRHLGLIGRHGHRGNIGIGDIEDADWPLGPQHAAERHRASQPAVRIDDEDIVDVVGQIGGFAAIVDHLADRPAIRHLDQRALHEAPGRIFPKGQRLLDLGAILGRQFGQDLLPLCLRQILENGRSVVGFQLTRSGGDFLAVELFENVLEDFLVEFGQRLGIEIALEDTDQLVALALANLFEDRRLTGGAEVGQECPDLLRPVFCKRRLDPPDKLRRHFIEEIAFRRSSTRLSKTLRLDDGQRRHVQDTAGCH
jgi:hypothetical protein